MTPGRVGASMCPPEEAPGCPGHRTFDKFRDCLTGALYAAPDDETGNVDGFGWWIGLILQYDAMSADTTWGPVFIPAGTFHVIGENNDGRIVVSRFKTAEGAQKCFDDWQADYSAYLAGVDARERSITSSTGRTGW